MNPLDQLPTYTWNDNGLWRELIDPAGRVIQRQFILKAKISDAKQRLNSLKMSLKTSIGFWFLRQGGDDCPHCGKFISIRTWREDLRRKEGDHDSRTLN